MNKNIEIIILAAGESKRLGTPKQLIPYKETNLINYIINESVLALRKNVIVVLGAYSRVIMNSIQNNQVDIVTNQNWQKGIGSTIKVGLRYIMENKQNTDGVMFLTVDQIRINSKYLAEMVQTYQTNDKPVIASEYAENYGIPAIFHKSLFKEILNLGDTEGCKSIISKHSENSIFLDFPGGEIDIDTIHDLKKIK